MPGRPLTATEAGEALRVFGTGLDYARPRVVEGVSWPNWIPQLQARLAGKLSPPYDNAITLGQTAYFPHVLQTSPGNLAGGQYGDMAWLIHELTHVWQYQHTGMPYLARAIWTQVHLGTSAYDYGGAAGLVEAAGAGKTLKDFNVEQQGDIARAYYVRLRLGQDTSAWEPFIEQLHPPG